MLAVICGAVLLGGCAAGPPAWGIRTAHLNRAYYLDGRDDRRIVYRDSQTPDARLTLLLVHGLGSSKGTWQYAVRAGRLSSPCPPSPTVLPT